MIISFIKNVEKIKNIKKIPGHYLVYFLVFVLIAFFSFLPENKWILNAEECRKSGGFCWAFLRAKATFLFFGFYPRELLWRPILLIVCSLAFAWRCYKPEEWNKTLFLLYVLLLCLFPLLLNGMGESQVSIEKWGGVPLSLMLIFYTLGPAFVLGIMLALARRSSMPVVAKFAIVLIELIRGVPLISLLFMASVMWPLFFPPSFSTPKLFRAIVVLIVFVAAYLAEVIRGGMQGIAKGQYEAAQSLGLSYFQSMRLIILPQAISHVVMPLCNTIIGMVKDTSLVMIIALFDFMGTVKASLSDAQWPGFSLEAYSFAAFYYLIFCRYLFIVGKNWERYLQQGKSR